MNGNAKTYTDRELDSRLEQICSLIKECKLDLGTTLSRVETQTIKTNGRVSTLEGKEAERRGAGKLLVIISSMFFSVLIAYLGWVGVQLNTVQTQMQNNIQAAVAQALLPYAHK